VGTERVCYYTLVTFKSLNYGPYNQIVSIYTWKPKDRNTRKI